MSENPTVNSLRIRPLTFEERKYTYKQSSQLISQTGSIGYLRGDFGSGGKEFHSTWFDHRTDRKTDEFKAELDDVVNALRSKSYGLLMDRQSMARFARNAPDSAFKGNYTTEYGFRVDTDKHSYLLRCNPQQGDYNFYCYCYVTEWLDRNIEKARQDIRFVSSDYKELFRLPDGEQITIIQSDGARQNFVCRYIDEAHVEVGDNLFHVCEFAERMERAGSRYEPTETPLPPKCLTLLPSSGDIISITRYERGYTLIRRDTDFSTIGGKEKFVEIANRKNKVSKAQEAAMLAGSLFGWDTPAAKPKNYDENGKAIKPKNRER